MRRTLVTALASAAALALAIYVVQAQSPERGSGKPRTEPAQSDSAETRESDDDDPDDRDPPSERPKPRGRKSASTVDQATTKRGIVTELHKNPEGEVGGLLLDDGTEVRFPPDASDKLKGVVAIKDRVTITGWTQAGETEIHAATIKNDASGKTVDVDRPPPDLRPEDAGGRRPERPTEGPSADQRPRRPAADEPDSNPKPKPKKSGTRQKAAPETPGEQPADPTLGKSQPKPKLKAQPGPIPGFMRIPAGEFEMGDHHGFVDPKHGGDETPIHTIRLDAFCIGIHDVTTKEYCEFLNSALAQKSIEVRDGGVYLAGGKELLAETRAMSRFSRIGWDEKTFTVLDKKEAHPIVCIRWPGAAAYCNWLSKQRGLPLCYQTPSWDCDFNKSGFRLPTEAEWEYAARGGQMDPYWNFPWANEADPAKANWPESKNPFRAGPLPWTTPVGFFNGQLHRKADFGWPGKQETFQTSDGANGFGLYDMAGNVWQFINDWYDRDYYAYSPAQNPPGPEQGSLMPDEKAYRGMRGGNWYNGEDGHSRVSNRNPSYYRGPQDPDHPYYHLGFRVVLPINAEQRPVIKPTPVQRVKRGGADGARRPARKADPANDGERPPAAKPRGEDESPVGDEPLPRGRKPKPASESDAGTRAKPRSGFVLRSPVVAEGGALPQEYTGDGSGVSPPLEWTGAPQGTQSFALIMHHVAPDEIKWYWVLYDISANVTKLPQDVQGIGKLGNNSVESEPGYAPPHSKGPGLKKYTLTLYALSASPKLTTPAAKVSREVLLAAIQDSILATAELNVTYTRGAAADDEEEAGPPRRKPREDAEEDAAPAKRKPREDADEETAPPKRKPRRKADDQDPAAEARPPEQPRDAVVQRAANPAPGGHTVGLFKNSPQACPGYTLFAPKHHTLIYLMNNAGQAVHTWKSEYEPGQSVYLLENGHLLHCCFTKNKGFTSGGEGGRLEEFDWEGNLVWEFEYSTDQHLSHHDIKPLPNGNVLLLAVEKKTYEECLAAGFNPRNLRDRQLFPESFIEVQPTRPKGGKIVWEWHVWDHLIQNNDRTLANYGDVTAHPELIDVDCNGRGAPAFWNHGNSIAYNAQLDQIMLSARGCNEIWVVDHGTTTKEAAGHTGGKRGKGGDLLYRWGNPAAYQRGSTRDRQLFQQHDAQWIPEGSPGAGHMLIFNNGLDRGYSTVDEIVPPLDARGNYVLSAESAYGPDKPVWTYRAAKAEDFYSAEISGAHRLPNGNTLICAGVTGTFFEVTPKGETVWQYVNPVVHNGILAQGEIPGKDHRGHSWNAVFKIHRYPLDYPGLAGQDLKPLGPIEQPAELCGKTGFADQAPNPEGPGGGKKGQPKERKPRVKRTDDAEDPPPQRKSKR